MAQAYLQEGRGETDVTKRRVRKEEEDVGGKRKKRWQEYLWKGNPKRTVYLFAIMCSPSIDVFKVKLKTHVFSQAFDCPN